MLRLGGILEGLLMASPDAALGLQVRGGPVFFFPGGDLQEQIDDSQEFCDDNAATLSRCNVDSGPFLGWSVGPGLGLHFAVHDAVRIRLDGFFEFTGSFLGEQVIENAGGKTVYGLYTDGFRVWTTLGFEFGAHMDHL